MTVERRNSLGPSAPELQPAPASPPLSSAGTDSNSGTQRGQALTAAYSAGFDLSADPGQNTGSGIGIGGNGVDNLRTAPGSGSADNDPSTVVGSRDPLVLQGDNDPSTGDGGGREVL